MSPWLIAQLIFLALQFVAVVVVVKSDYGSVLSDWASRANTPLLVGNITCGAMMLISKFAN